MNRELFSMRANELARDALGYLASLGVSGSPVLDDEGMPIGMVSMRDLLRIDDDDVVEQHMSRPVVTVNEHNTIEDAAKLLGETGFHRLVVADEEGRAVGIISSLDIVRGLIGMPASHPPVFPHYDEDNHVIWTDDIVFELDRVEAAPDGPGVLALIHGGAGRLERMVWAEAAHNVRTRLIDMLSTPQDKFPMLQHWLDQGDLRFRAAFVADPGDREETVNALLAKTGRAPVPKGN
ncbi:CBS domain-containing protein [Haliangium sp.]|uniref:CBS domain-containing protein n=1 Tax=Haliangium sp. TaxID=2663208 RepID=UPI003D0A7924